MSLWTLRVPPVPRLDLSRSSRGHHGGPGRRQPRQPHDSDNGLLPEEPEEDHVLSGLQEQAVPALGHLSAQRNLRQARQHVRTRKQADVCWPPFMLADVIPPA